MTTLYTLGVYCVNKFSHVHTQVVGNKGLSGIHQGNLAKCCHYLFHSHVSNYRYIDTTITCCIVIVLNTWQKEYTLWSNEKGNICLKFKKKTTEFT